MNINADEVGQEYVMSKFANERDLRAAMVAEIVALRTQIAATQPPKDKRGQGGGALPEKCQKCAAHDDGDSWCFTWGRHCARRAALAASAPAQQATPPQPVAAEVVNRLRDTLMMLRNHTGMSLNQIEMIDAALSGTGSDERKKGEA